MEPSSSDSIIYLSPNNARYPLKPPRGSSLLDDEPAPPHTQNPFQDALTPEKRSRRVARALEKSSSSKPLPGDPFHDPYAHFENDHLHPSILSKAKDEKGQAGRGEEGEGGEEQEPRRQTPLKPKQYEELMINSLLASPRKRPPGLQAVKQEPQRPLEEQYEEVLERMAEGKAFSLPEVFFFGGAEEESLSKLVCFELNPKNGKCVKFDLRSKTCHPFFRCYGCRKAFAVAAALGGHLSKCSRKLDHLRRSKHLHFHQTPEQEEQEESGSEQGEVEVGEAARGEGVKVEESESSSLRGSKGRRKKGEKQAKQARRAKQPAFRTRAQVLRSSSRFGRLPLARLAKLRAGLLIHEVIDAHFG